MLLPIDIPVIQRYQIVGASTRCKPVQVPGKHLSNLVFDMLSRWDAEDVAYIFECSLFDVSRDEEPD